MLEDTPTGGHFDVIEITPEMIEAGTNYITHSLALLEPVISSDEELAEFACSLYKAMASTGGTPKYRS